MQGIRVILDALFCAIRSDKVRKYAAVARCYFLVFGVLWLAVDQL